MIVGWSILAIVFCVILTVANIDPNRKVSNNAFFQSCESLLKIIAVFQLYEWPLKIWAAGLFLVIFLVLAAGWISDEGNELAAEQRDSYLKGGFCADKFNSSNVGCFTIHGVEGSGHFIIATTKTNLIYLSRECACSEGCKPRIKLNILEKTPSTEYSIVRDYIYRESKEISFEKRQKVTGVSQKKPYK